MSELVTTTAETLAEVLAEHTPHVGPITGSWTCPPPCNAVSTNGDIHAGTLTSRDERSAEWRTHLTAEILAALGLGGVTA